MRHRAEHIRIRKPRPSGSEVILMLMLGGEEKPSLKRPRRATQGKNNHAPAKLQADPPRIN